MDDTWTGGGSDPDFEAQFARLMQEVEQNRPAAVHEPSARERQLAAQDRLRAAQELTRVDGRPADRSTGRQLVRNIAVFVVVVGLLVGGMQAVQMLHKPKRTGTAADAAPARSAYATTAAAAASTTATAAAATTANAATAVPAATAADVRQIPVAELFPATVKGPGGTVYTLVTSGKLADCVHSDMVGAALAQMFARSRGCVGGEGALYTDEAKDQFDAFVFTLESPSDVVSILSRLSMNYSDIEMAPVAPPAGSGLATLGATSGMVQSLAGGGQSLGIFMAQWADGRSSDYQGLEDLLRPLSTTIGGRFTAGG